MLKLRHIVLPLLLLTAAAASAGGKRDFRGAWIQTVFQGYDTRTTAQNKQYLTSLLDSLDEAGINAVFFQVRTRGDAFYPSDIEPWSHFLTGKVGKAPFPAWDPLQFMIDECHTRGMELHAWLNPYRAPSVSERDKLPASHILRKHPGRFVRYGKTYYFNPALQVNRDYICRIIRDIVSRYNVDGIHFDDYFYPYPVKGATFNDDSDYAAARTKLSRADWRRQNVDKLIEQVSRTIADVKPWVRFGISPFGIWRNAASDPRGSATNGLQNYDDLYADVPLWASKGWIDYQAPQLYWSLDNRRAPYRELCTWWARNGYGRHIYIGEDAEVTAKAGELDAKMAMTDLDSVQGHVWWYAASIRNVSHGLRRKHYHTRALVPEYLWKHAEPAPKPQRPSLSGGMLSWNADPHACKWVVYRFSAPDKIDIDNPAAICGVVYKPEFRPTRSGIYVVTALDFANGESAPSQQIKVKL